MSGVTARDAALRTERQPGPAGRRPLAVRVGIAGAVGYVLSALVALAVPQSTLGLTVLNAGSAASALLLVGVVIGLGGAGLGRGAAGRAGLWLVGASWLLVGAAEVVSLLRGQDTAVVYVVATALHLLGMAPVAIGAIRRPTQLPGLRWWPLACLLYLVAAMPAFGQPGPVADLALAGWGAAWLVLATRLPRRGDRRTR